MHWDGSRWSVVAAPDVGRLGAMAAITADDAWALGSGLLHWDGTSWHEVRPPRGMGAEYDAISASGPNDVWLAGVRDGPLIGASTGGLSTVIAHFDGRRWTQMVPPNPGTRDNYLNGIVALAPDDVWAAGYSTDVGKSEPEDSTLTMHWDGSSWSVVPSPDPSRSLNVIWGMGSDGEIRISGSRALPGRRSQPACAGAQMGRLGVDADRHAAFRGVVGDRGERNVDARRLGARNPAHLDPRPLR